MAAVTPDLDPQPHYESPRKGNGLLHKYRRFYIGPRVRLDESNKGPSRDDQRSLAAATTALGAGPRKPRPLVMGTPQDEKVQVAALYQRLAAAHFARTSWGFQKPMEMNGVDFSDAPPIPGTLPTFLLIFCIGLLTVAGAGCTWVFIVDQCTGVG